MLSSPPGLYCCLLAMPLPNNPATHKIIMFWFTDDCNRVRNLMLVECFLTERNASGGSCGEPDRRREILWWQEAAVAGDCFLMGWLSVMMTRWTTFHKGHLFIPWMVSVEELCYSTRTTDVKPPTGLVDRSCLERTVQSLKTNSSSFHLGVDIKCKLSSLFLLYIKNFS